MNPLMILCLSLLFLTITISLVSGEEEADKKCNSDEYKCGDMCVHMSDSCRCGNVTLTISSPSYCCTATGDKCTGGWWFDATCSRGQPVPRSETCNNKCPAEDG